MNLKLKVTYTDSMQEAELRFLWLKNTFTRTTLWYNAHQHALFPSTPTPLCNIFCMTQFGERKYLVFPQIQPKWINLCIHCIYECVTTGMELWLKNIYTHTHTYLNSYSYLSVSAGLTLSSFSISNEHEAQHFWLSYSWAEFYNNAKSSITGNAYVPRSLG